MRCRQAAVPPLRFSPSTRCSVSHATLPPVALRRPVTVTRHGELFTDDYAWLREKDDPAVLAHLEAENAYAEARLAPTAELRETLYREVLGTDLDDPYLGLKEMLFKNYPFVEENAED